MVFFLMRREPERRKPGRDHPGPRRQRKLTQADKMKAMQQVIGFQMAFGKTKVGETLHRLDYEAGERLKDVIGRKTSLVDKSAFEQLKKAEIMGDAELRQAFSDFNTARLNFWKALLGYAENKGASETTIWVIKELVAGIEQEGRNKLG